MSIKIYNSELIKVLKDYNLSQWILFALSGIMLGTEFTVSSPAYTEMLGMGLILGYALAFGMAILFAALPKITAKLFVKKRIKLGMVGVLCAAGLLFIAYLGQKAVAIEQSNNVLDIYLAGTIGVESNSSSEIGQEHLIATGLLALLFNCSLFLSYVFYKDEAEFKPTEQKLIFSRLRRTIDYLLIPLQGRCERAEANPLRIAEDKVSAKIADLEHEKLRLQRELDITLGRKNYELKALSNLRNRIIAVIEIAYKY